jgi:hypothetical protein
MADVFLSYRNTDDRRKLVGRLATILRAYRIDVWWDYGLDAGENYRDQIVKALGEAKVVIPLWCEESVRSQWVIMEAELGRDKLLPARLQHVAPPPQFESIQAAHLERWDGSILDPQLDAFIRDLCKRLKISPMLPPDTRAELAQLPKLKPLPRGPGRKPHAQPQPDRRNAAGAAALVVASLLALGAGGAWLFSSLMSGPPARTAEADPVGAPAISSPVAPPNDPLAALQWHLQGPDKGGIGALDYAQRTGATGEGVVVAILGTGLFPGHPDFSASQLLPGADLVSDIDMANDGNGRDTNTNDPGERCDQDDPNKAVTVNGNFTASMIIARTSNGVGVAGIAPKAGVIPVRVFGRCGGTLSDINDGIRWAAGVAPFTTARGVEVSNANRAHIIALPIGMFEPCPARMQEAINEAVAAGSIVVASAGNARVDVKYFAPGGCDNVVSVAASDARGQLTPYSNFGERINIVAPGGDMTRDDNKDGRPDGILAGGITSNCVDPERPGEKVDRCYYSYENGTTYSAIVAAGALALLKSAHPQDDNAALVARLQKAARITGPEQCSGQCSSYPNTETIAGMPGLCYRPCGAGVLDLSLAN